MNKKELIAKLAYRTQLKSSTCEAVINALSSEIENTLCAGADFPLHGIGKWVVRTRKARTVRNPRTGEAMSIPSRQAVTFKVSSRLNDNVNSYSDDVGMAMSKLSAG